MPTMATVLAENGYRTRGILGNHLIYRPLALVEGLQRIDTYSPYPFGGPQASQNLGRGRNNLLFGDITRRLTDQAIEWAGTVKQDQPSFLWLHYFDPHNPYTPLDEYMETPGPAGLTDEQRAYRAEVRLVDHEIGRLMKALKTEGVYDDSIIILTSDHGEGFGEHGEIYHGYDLYQELLHVPLLIRMPGGAGSRQVSDYVPTNALLPTLLDLLSIREQPHEGWPPSLRPVIENVGCGYDAPIVSGANHRNEPQWSIVSNGAKYIYREKTHREEVYDLERDPFEKQPIESPSEDFLLRARQALAKHHKFSKRILEEEDGGRRGPSSEGLRDRIKSLGYIQ